LAQPIVARLAVIGSNGQPTVRPVWFLFEDGSFWWLTSSSYSKLEDLLAADPRVSLVIDTCDLDTGKVFAVTARGRATVHPFDAERIQRKLSKYLGADLDQWPLRFRRVLSDPSTDTRLVELRPSNAVNLRDLSFDPPGSIQPSAE